MNRCLLIFLLAAHCLCAGRLAFAEPTAPPALAAQAYVLQDFHSGKILVEHNADEPIEPASLTKIMTAYVVFDALAQNKLALDDTAKISNKAWRNPDAPGWLEGSRMFAEVGSRVAVGDLLQGLVIQSGNDASVALAEHIAGSEEAFAELMNEYARRLGLTGTHFMNSTGWPVDGHQVTARDIATLSRALLRDFPDFYPMFGEKYFTYNSISQANRNTLLWKDPSIDGIKTGHTATAGYCVAASAERNGMRLIAVVLGTDGSNARAEHSMTLLNYGFRSYETHKLFAAGVVLREARIWKGEDNVVPLGLGHDFYVTIPHGEYKNLKSTMTVKKSIAAPAAKNQAFGDVLAELNGEVVQRQPLVALQEVGRGNIFQRMIDHLIYLLQ
jgi:D-alanyl-D-alanine carboxypeptidase (penicillin-binding protein 5/6)